MNLAQLTTFRVGGPAQYLTTVKTRAELIDFCAAHPLNPIAEVVPPTPSTHPSAAHPPTAHQPAPVLFIGGGSNLLISDAGFPGPVCLVRTSGVTMDPRPDGTCLVTAAAGVVWDELVAFTTHRGLAGLEALSGIPGLVGATPIQNVGAYGAEVADTLISISAFDRLTCTKAILTADNLEFGYRDSLLKRSAAHYGQPRYVVLDVTFRLVKSPDTAPVRYGQLATALGVDVGETASPARVRQAVLHLRTSKGMVLNDADHDTWSAGSFFTNPILPANSGPGDPRIPEGAPAYPVRNPRTGEVDATVTKTSAAWLIDHAGFHKGFALSPRASVSTKHALALTNRGSATAADIVALARHIQAGVRNAYGITLHPEPNLVGVSL